MNKKYNLKLDLQFRCNNSTMKFDEFDNNTSDFFIRVTRAGELIDISKAIVTLVVIKPDNSVDAQFVDIDSNRAYCDLKPTMKNLVGKYEAIASITVDGETVNTGIDNPIIYEVTENKFLRQLNQKVVTEERFTLLTDMINRLSTIEISEEQRVINEAERILSEENRKIEEAKRVEAELIRQHEEADRAKYDATRESNENIRKQNESIRLANETNRIDEETKRVEEEANRVEAEQLRKDNYNFMTEDEERRRVEANAHKEAEKIRAQAENTRVNEEAKRRTTEQARVSAENTRVNNENTRKANETTRQTNETHRVEAETQRQSRYNSFILDAEANTSNFENYTNNAKVKEEERKSNELDRKSQEAKRVSNEVERISNENTRKANEVTRIESEKQRADAENLRKEKIIEIQSDYDSLKKVIIDENASANLQNQINQTNSQLEHKAKKTYIYVEDFGAKGDGVTDDTVAFQNAIDYASINNKNICLLNKTYALTSFTFKANMSIISNEYATLQILASNNESFIKFDSGAITNLNYSSCLKNVFISCNSNNISQKIIDVTAMNSSNGVGGGLWHFTFENVRIQTVSNNQIGIYFKADDTSQGVDVANQYINFKNVNIYKSSDTSCCLKIIGQIGQTKFDSCEINGINSSVGGWLIEFEPLQSNDNAFMPITFDNCTFQSCDKGVYAKNAHVIINNCHVEGITNQFVQANGNLAHIEFNNSNISGGIKPFRIEGTGTISGKGNSWNAPTGVACALEGKAIGTYLFDLDLYMDNMYLCHESPYYEHSDITLNVGYSKNVILTTKVNDIQIIKGMFKAGDILTITNMADTNCNIENNNFTSNSNLYWAGKNVITLKKYHSAKFISNGESFILTDVQRDVNDDVVIKTKDVTLTFSPSVLTTEADTGINFDKIIGVFLLQSDNVFNTSPIISVRTNGKLWAKAESNPSQSYDIIVRVKYLE